MTMTMSKVEIQALIYTYESAVDFGRGGGTRHGHLAHDDEYDDVEEEDDEDDEAKDEDQEVDKSADSHA